MLEDLRRCTSYTPHRNQSGTAHPWSNLSREALWVWAISAQMDHPEDSRMSWKKYRGLGKVYQCTALHSKHTNAVLIHTHPARNFLFTPFFILWSKKQIKVYGIKTTPGWVKNYWIFILGWIVPLRDLNINAIIK